MGSDSIDLRVLFELPHPRARIAEHPQPRRMFAPFARMPGELHRAHHALGVRHEQRKAPIGIDDAGDAER